MLSRTSLLASTFLTASLILLLQQPAEARPHGGIASGALPNVCPYPVDNGCGAADKTAIFQDPSALINARQGGQTWVSSHPTTKNVPGVDYPIGPTGSTVFKDPSIDALPCGTYDAANHRVLCNNGGSHTFDGWDFTHAGVDTHPVSLQFGPNTTGVCTVTNSKFLVNALSGDTGESPIWFKNGDCSRIFDHNICAGSGAAGTLVPCIEDDSRSSTNSAEFLYNAFPNQSFMRVITSVGSGGAGDTWDFCYNYVYGLGQFDDGGVTHGEIDLYGGQSPGGVGYTVTRKKWCSNFIVWAGATPTVNNATILAGTGDYNNMKVLNTIMDSNVIIANPYTGPGGGATVGRVLVDGKWANFGNFEAKDNDLDPSGAHYCGVNGLLVQNDAGTVSGNNITGLTGSVGVEVGYFVIFPDTTRRNVTAVVGSTVTFDGASRSDGSVSLTFVPGMTTFVSTGNKNIRDGSSTDLAFPQFQNAACNGAL
jgi:hypothetical protein